MTWEMMEIQVRQNASQATQAHSLANIKCKDRNELGLTL